MRSDDDHDFPAGRAAGRGRDYSLYYFERRDGGRYYFRLTRLGLLVLILLTIIPITAILILFTFTRRKPPNVDTNIVVPPATPYSANKPIIRQVPAPSPPKNIKLPTLNSPTPLPIQTPDGNANRQLSPRHTPPPTPSESPP